MTLQDIYGPPVLALWSGDQQFERLGEVVDERKAAKYARAAEHIVIDTQARPEQEDLEALADGCDRLIIPCTPDALALDAMMLTVKALHQLGSDKYRILLTIIPPKPSKDGEEAKKMLSEAGLPMLKSGIRRYAAFKKAALEGTIVSEIADKKARIAWGDYQDLGSTRQRPLFRRKYRNRGSSYWSLCQDAFLSLSLDGL